MSTYTTGLTLKTTRVIKKSDMTTMCEFLNSKEEFSGLCRFEPEGISEGGIVYKFQNECDKNWYKSVRLCVTHGCSGGKWYWVNENVMTEWSESSDIIFDTNKKFTIFLKSFHGAPLFTLAELRIWEACFNEIGIVKVGKYPSKKSLSTSESFA